MDFFAKNLEAARANISISSELEKGKPAVSVEEAGGGFDKSNLNISSSYWTGNVVIRAKGLIYNSGLILNNKIYYGSNDHNVYEYDPTTKEQKIVIVAGKAVCSSGVALNNKVYFSSRDCNIYEYDQATGKQKIVIKKHEHYKCPGYGYIESTGITLNNKVYLGSYDGSVHEYDPISGHDKVVINETDEASLNNILVSCVASNNKLYFSFYKRSIYEYDPATGQKVIIETDDYFAPIVAALNDKAYFLSYDKVYEYDPATEQVKVVIITGGMIYQSGFILNNMTQLQKNKNLFYQWKVE